MGNLKFITIKILKTLNLKKSNKNPKKVYLPSQSVQLWWQLRVFLKQHLASKSKNPNLQGQVYPTYYLLV